MKTDPVKLSRRSDPVTSHLAAARVGEFSGAHHEQILNCLRMHGPQTSDGMESHIGLDAYRIRKRLPELERDKLVRPTGKLLRSKSGRMEREWQLV